MDGILERSFILSNLSAVVSLSGVDLFSLGAGGQKGSVPQSQFVELYRNAGVQPYLETPIQE